MAKRRSKKAAAAAPAPKKTKRKVATGFSSRLLRENSREGEMRF